MKHILRRCNCSLKTLQSFKMGFINFAIDTKKDLLLCDLYRNVMQSLSRVNRDSVEGSVIQATGTVEFEDDLRTGVYPGG